MGVQYIVGGGWGSGAPQGLKPDSFCAITARLKSGPDTNLIYPRPNGPASDKGRIEPGLFQNGSEDGGWGYFWTERRKQGH
jgi:hypothetical protein